MVLLGADVERQAVRHQTLPERELQDVGGIDRLAPELARQRPFGAGAVADDATEHAAATRGAGHLLDFGFAVDGEQADAERERRSDLGLFLDGVAVGNAVGAGAGFEHGSGFADRCDIERAAEAGEEFQDFRGRIGLHRVVYLGVRQHSGEAVIVFADDIKIDDEAGAAPGPVLEKFANARGHFQLNSLSGHGLDGPFPRRASKERAGGSVGRGERLDAARGADELHHHRDAAQHEHAVEQARAERADREQVGDRPASGESRAEYLDTDQDRRADDGEHVLPDDAAGALGCGLIHGGGTFFESGRQINPLA